MALENNDNLSLIDSLKRSMETHLAGYDLAFPFDEGRTLLHAVENSEYFYGAFSINPLERMIRVWTRDTEDLQLGRRLHSGTDRNGYKYGVVGDIRHKGDGTFDIIFRPIEAMEHLGTLMNEERAKKIYRTQIAKMTGIRTTETTHPLMDGLFQKAVENRVRELFQPASRLKKTAKAALNRLKLDRSE